MSEHFLYKKKKRRKGYHTFVLERGLGKSMKVIFSIRKWRGRRGLSHRWRRQTHVKRDFISWKAWVAVVEIDVIAAGEVKFSLTFDEFFFRFVKRRFHNDSCQTIFAAVVVFFFGADYGESDTLIQKNSKREMRNWWKEYLDSCHCTLGSVLNFQWRMQWGRSTWKGTR